MNTTILWQQGRRWHLVGIVLAAVALMAGFSVSCQKPKATPSPGSRSTAPAATTIYPDFPIVFYQGQKALKGREPRFSNLLGDPPIVLNYWASNCPPCSAEMPEFQKVYEAYQGKVLSFGLDIGRFFPQFGDEDDSKQELRRLGITYPAGTPSDIKTVEALGVRSLPSTVFITPRGERYRAWDGMLNQKKLAELVEDLLNASGQR